MNAHRLNKQYSNQFSRSDFARDSFTSKSMYRTELCRNFMSNGTCRYEADCVFAHGSRDRRRSYSDGKMNRNLKDVNENTYKKAVCRYMVARKACPYGNRCIFIHDVREKSREIRDVTPERCAVEIQRDEFDSEAKCWWKTRLCNKWMMNGCVYGAGCTYAHGRAELRSPLSTRSECRTTWLTPRTSKKNEHTKERTNNQKTAHTMFSLEWKSTKKIVGIYADWIDDDLRMHYSDNEQIV